MAFVRAAREASPGLDPVYKWMWRAWQRLNLDRPWTAGGMGPAMPRRISYVQVLQWAAYHDLSDMEVAVLDHCLIAMDNDYLSHYKDKVEQEMKKR